jgi:hypothetical protein
MTRIEGNNARRRRRRRRNLSALPVLVLVNN